MIIALWFIAMVPCLAASVGTVTKTPPTKGKSNLYTFNREPLQQNPFAKLPIGCIKPKGWLEAQLKLMAKGMVGHLEEVSHFLGPESGWLDPSRSGWEELPYWLKGYGDLGYVLGDKRIQKEALRWYDAIFSSQQSDGYFGPQENKKNDDLWPNMVVLYAVQSLYEATGDKRVIPFMSKYFQYQNNLPLDNLLPASWQKVRAGDNLQSVYWLYNLTGETWLLELGEKLHKKTENWTDSIVSYHGVNFAQGFRQPAVYYQQAKDAKYLQATQKRQEEMMSEYGQVPGGLYASDENCRPGKTGAEQGTETCSMVEYMNSDQELLRITGAVAWADHCEDIAFNSLPCSYSPDFRGIHYITAPNQTLLHKGGEHVFQNQGRMVSYSALETYRCCQHNVAMGWPYYAEHLWLATKNNGLAAIFYAKCEMEALVGDGTLVRIREETDYPFDEHVHFTITTPKKIGFPLFLRVPGWCRNAIIKVNGEKLDIRTEPASYVVIDRQWAAGDQIDLYLPMDVRVIQWAKQNDGVSVRRGPLWYSLKIDEKWEPYTDDRRYERWPDQEVKPSSAWNYALLVNKENPCASIISVNQVKKLADQPFTADAAPLFLTAKARRLPSWKLVTNSPGPVPNSPTVSTEPIEEITLIPMGCAHLRISVFPTVEQ